jgi:3-oxoacyl-[acyl-carrier protein] reductase
VNEAKEPAMFDLSGKTALVTGATGGIGGDIASASRSSAATSRTTPTSTAW